MTASSSSSTSDDIQGSCFCQATRYTVHNPPNHITMTAYCHCSRCQRLNGTVFIWTTHWKKDGISWHGKEPERFTVIPDRKFRLRCKDCGSSVGTWNSVKEQWSLWPACFERDPETNKLLHQDEEWLRPTCHMFYGTRVRDVNDDLPKWDGFEGKSERLYP